jgi:hypothetical protein
MLAEIFLMYIEMQLRLAAANAARPASDPPFVPVTLPREIPRKPA